jgi:hypothetical protein
MIIGKMIRAGARSFVSAAPTWDWTQTYNGSLGAVNRVAMSTTGQYQMAWNAGVSGDLLLSTNYGLTFSGLSQTGTWFSASISDDGQKIIASKFTPTGSTARVFYSSNGGSSFTSSAPGGNPATSHGYGNVHMAPDGSYCIAIRSSSSAQLGGVYKSTDGINWTIKSSGQIMPSNLLSGSRSHTQTHCSGANIVMGPFGSFTPRVVRSADSGETWSIDTAISDLMTNTYGFNADTMAFSMAFGLSVGTDMCFFSDVSGWQQPAYSLDSGTTNVDFTQFPSAGTPIDLTLEGGTGNFAARVSSNGSKITFSPYAAPASTWAPNSDTGLWVSGDGFSGLPSTEPTWTSKLDTVTFVAIGMSANGNAQAAVEVGGTIYTYKA